MFSQVLPTQALLDEIQALREENELLRKRL